MDAQVCLTEVLIKPRDGHAPLSCGNWIPGIRGRKMLAWVRRKAQLDCQVAWS